MKLIHGMSEVAVIDSDLAVYEQKAAVAFIQDDDWVNIHKSDLPQLIEVLTDLYNKYQGEVV
ncbi:hypothetical protein D3C81_1951720 [compost metagenome]